MEIKKIYALAISIVSLFSLFLLPIHSPVFAAEYTITTKPSSETPPAVQKVMPAVVSIIGTKNVSKLELVYGNPFIGDPRFENLGIEVPLGYREISSKVETGVGSGFIGTHDGYIITARHVVDDPDSHYLVVLSDGTKKPASVVYKDPQNDVALIKIDGEYPDVAFLGDSTILQSGQYVAAVGNAFGKYSRSISEGNVVDFGHNITARGEDTVKKLFGLMETTVPLVPGYSGGPMVDKNGNVVAINVAIDEDTGRGYSIPINIVKHSLAEIRT